MGRVSVEVDGTKRREITSVFIAFLTAVGYQELIVPVREYVQANGMTWIILAMFTMFFVTSIRFLIGCHLHLTSDQLTRGPGNLWFFDLMIITLEMTVIIFIGGLASPEASAKSPFGFVGLLSVLFAIDVAWIVLQWLMSTFVPGWHRKEIPWQWGALNTGLLLLIAIVAWAFDNRLEGMAFLWLTVICVLGFFVDVILVDRYKLLGGHS